MSITTDKLQYNQHIYIFKIKTGCLCILFQYSSDYLVSKEIMYHLNRKKNSSFANTASARFANSKTLPEHKFQTRRHEITFGVRYDQLIQRWFHIQLETIREVRKRPHRRTNDDTYSAPPETLFLSQDRCDVRSRSFGQQTRARDEEREIDLHWVVVKPRMR